MNAVIGSARVRIVLLLAAALITGAIMDAVGLNPAASQAIQLQSVPVADDPGLDPAASAWDGARSIEVPLTAQNIAYPRGGFGAESVTLRAINTQDKLYLRVDWRDQSQDDRPVSLDAFSDAVALEFPARASVSTPSICMGQSDGAVNIWHWRAVLQNGGRPTWRESRPNLYVDDDPWQRIEPDLAYPARYLDNPISGALGGPVTDLTARAFGTLTATETQLTRGSGTWEDGVWSVVFERDLPVSADDEAALGGGTTTDMAVAVWDGARGDRDGQKSVSQFVKLSIPATMTVTDDDALDVFLLFAGGAIALAGAAAVFWWMVHETE